MTDREQQLERALSLVVMTDHAVRSIRAKRGIKASENTARAAVREFNLAIESARALLAQRTPYTTSPDGAKS